MFVQSDEHFQRLRGLTPGTAVSFQKEKRKLKGTFRGKGPSRVDDPPEPFVRIEYGNKYKTTELVKRERAHLVEITGGFQGRLPEAQTGRRMKPGADFADAFFPDTSLEAVAINSRVLCAIVGRANVLAEELQKTELSLPESAGQNPTQGTLHDVIRVRKFATEADHFFADVLPVDSKPDEFNPPPPVVVFDGSDGYLKQRMRWAQSNHVVILDRTEPRFDDAVHTFNEHYISRRVNDDPVSVLDNLPEAPPSVEIDAFEESSR